MSILPDKLSIFDEHCPLIHNRLFYETKQVIVLRQTQIRLYTTERHLQPEIYLMRSRVCTVCSAHLDSSSQEQTCWSTWTQFCCAEPESQSSRGEYYETELGLRVILISQHALSWGQIACVHCMFLNSCKKIEGGKKTNIALKKKKTKKTQVNIVPALGSCHTRHPQFEVFAFRVNDTICTQLNTNKVLNAQISSSIYVDHVNTHGKGPGPVRKAPPRGEITSPIFKTKRTCILMFSF